MPLGSIVFRILCTKNYEDRFKLLEVIEEKLAHTFMRHMIVLISASADNQPLHLSIWDLPRRYDSLWRKVELNKVGQ